MTTNVPATEAFPRARASMSEAGCDFALLSSVANVTYVTGTEVPVPVGAGAELTYGPWLALIPAREATGWFVVPAGGAAFARERAVGFDVLAFDMLFDSFQPVDARASYLNRIREALRAAGLDNARATVGVEMRSLPRETAALMALEFPRVTLVNAEAALVQARLVKTEREIALLRRAAKLADVAQETLAELVRTAGQTEFAMFGEISARVFAEAGRDIPLSGELVTGPRTTTVEYPNGPRTRTTEPGDAALMDLSGRSEGYWFDCTNTHVIDAEPTATQLKFARASQDACEAAMATLRPGAKASDAAKAAETAFATHGLPMAHYAGHQIGVTVNELPRLVPYDDTPIEAGMVFSVEPGAYEGAGGSFGARSEKMVLVTPTGPEILSTFSWGI
ncbi:MAG: Xaa-Pro dipeptidase [Thermomicrobiales bacterium]|nr:Xaa-Pro dipeptidase [Thermomicrobiales bacterium]